MSASLVDRFRLRIADLDPSVDRYATEVVARLLASAGEEAVSDVHLLPQEQGSGRLRMFWRIDGVLHEIAVLERGPNIIGRLKVLSELLTYRTDVPQEGRIRTGDERVEMRVSTFPTIHGEKAVVRLFVGSGRYRDLGDLGLPEDIAAQLERLLSLTSGAVVVAGPAGSGKTTTLYASLRHILQHSPTARSIVTLEDPVEALVSGVSQSQVTSDGAFNYANGLRSLMRQDPEVIMVGEIRDRATAETVFQAALTGQLVLSSFHAGSSAEAIGRLLDLDVEPYLLRSGLLGVLTQRLVRRLCRCAMISEEGDAGFGLAVGEFHVPSGCVECRQTGYSGRLLLCESLDPRQGEIGRGILERVDTDALQARAITAGMVTIRERAVAAVRTAQTSPVEVRRVLGGWT
jgi:type II secretory ATPase GspE/PulE/Tfp pilus assembly ATPase PilB-like protein